METPIYLGIDCGSVSLNLVLRGGALEEPLCIYRRTQGRPLHTMVEAADELLEGSGSDVPITGVLVTGSAGELISRALGVPAINEISAHAAGAFQVDSRIRTIIEIGGQDSKFIRMEPPENGVSPRIVSFRMNEICAAGTGAFLDEQAGRLGIPVESFAEIAERSESPAPIAGRCAVFAKTDMIHKAAEGTPLPDILFGTAFALARNYLGTLIRGDALVPLVSLQGGVMANGAVVAAFREMLGLAEDEVIIPPHFKVLGALGCAVLAHGQNHATTLEEVRDLARAGQRRIIPGSYSQPLEQSDGRQALGLELPEAGDAMVPPLIMGLDVGSVSAKGVILNGEGRIIREDYRLSKGRPLEALDEVMGALTAGGLRVNACAVTGSGRLIAGRLLGANLILNEISAQARAAVEHDPAVDTIVEIGGQDSKWISLDQGELKDFEMNRVCAAGTGSFLMEQADRLGLSMGQEFSDAAFSSASPSDLGTRCTVFMESDLIHHQNNGASQADLSAGVCISVVRNYLERVANHKPLGEKTILVGGVAANPAVRAAFQLTTGLSIESPAYFKVSGALGAALKVLDRIRSGDMAAPAVAMTLPELEAIPRDRFVCGRCSNQCSIDRYRINQRVVFSGGRCERWELEDRSGSKHRSSSSEETDPVVQFTEQLSSESKDERAPVTPDQSLAGDPRAGSENLDVRPLPSESDSELFGFRTALLDSIAESAPGHGSDSDWTTASDSRLVRPVVGMIRSPQFYEWLPFWKTFLDTLGIELKVAPRSNREQFERGARFLQVETCLPMKVMAGQVSALVNAGVKTIFHPTILTEPPVEGGTRVLEHCPYIQASSQFLKGAFHVEWQEPAISCDLDPDAFRNEHVRFAREIGFSELQAISAFEKGMQAQRKYDEALADRGRQFTESLGDQEYALVILGKPYHTSDSFLNMNLPSLFKSLGIRAVPGDLFPLESLPTRNPIPWKHQLRMIGVARAVARDPRLFPVMITFFGCGPDPFTMRHIRKSLKEKPLLMLEMDEHTSRAGLMTRLEAFLDHVAGYMDRTPRLLVSVKRSQVAAARVASEEDNSGTGPSASTEGSAGPAEEKGVRGPSIARSAAAKNDPESRAARVKRSRNERRVDAIYIPHFGDHAYAFAAVARAMDIDAHVLPPPDDESARIGRPHLMGGECHPYALILGDYLKLASELAPEREQRSIFCIPAYSACRLGQYPVYIEQIRKERGHSMRVVGDLNQAMTAFGISKRNRDQVFLRTWEGLTSFDMLQRVFVELRPLARDKDQIQQTYVKCRDLLFRSLSKGNALEGLEAALHEMSQVPVDHHPDRPVIGVTGDYYTRVVSFANNSVYEVIESLGGTVWTPPTFSDGLKVFLLQEISDGTLPAESDQFDEKCSLYVSVLLSEMRIKRLHSAERCRSWTDIDPLGRRMRQRVSEHMDARFPPGITAPFATALSYVDQGADGILNLITLNCSFGTVVTAALARAMKKRSGVPLLTLIYDGLKKTNEKTRLEAFMEQVKDQAQRQ